MAHKLDLDQKLWEKAAAFHGHVCPGLTIGYRAALYAIDLLELAFSEDEQPEFLIPMSAIAVARRQAQTGFGCPAAKSFAWTAMRRMIDLMSEQLYD